LRPDHVTTSAQKNIVLRHQWWLLLWWLLLFLSLWRQIKTLKTLQWSLRVLITTTTATSTSIATSSPSSFSTHFIYSDRYCKCHSSTAGGSSEFAFERLVLSIVYIVSEMILKLHEMMVYTNLYHTYVVHLMVCYTFFTPFRFIIPYSATRPRYHFHFHFVKSRPTNSQSTTTQTKYDEQWLYYQWLYYQWQQFKVGFVICILCGNLCSFV
jgi:hypothetical protein